jgi:hypothetical protein
VSALLEDALASEVSVAGVRKPFGELSGGEVDAQAAALGEASGFGHRSRVGAVAAAWRELARVMSAQGAAKVSDLGAAEIESRAERLWVIPPGGSLLP